MIGWTSMVCSYFHRPLFFVQIVAFFVKKKERKKIHIQNYSYFSIYLGITCSKYHLILSNIILTYKTLGGSLCHVRWLITLKSNTVLCFIWLSYVINTAVTISLGDDWGDPEPSTTRLAITCNISAEWKESVINTVLHKK